MILDPRVHLDHRDLLGTRALLAPLAPQVLLGQLAPLGQQGIPVRLVPPRLSLGPRVRLVQLAHRVALVRLVRQALPARLVTKVLVVTLAQPAPPAALATLALLVQQAPLARRAFRVSPVLR